MTTRRRLALGSVGSLVGIAAVALLSRIAPAAVSVLAWVVVAAVVVGLIGWALLPVLRKPP